jgi:hypothetical protein
MPAARKWTSQLSDDASIARSAGDARSHLGGHPLVVERTEERIDRPYTEAADGVDHQQYREDGCQQHYPEEARRAANSIAPAQRQPAWQPMANRAERKCAEEGRCDICCASCISSSRSRRANGRARISLKPDRHL